MGDVPLRIPATWMETAALGKGSRTTGTADPGLPTSQRWYEQLQAMRELPTSWRSVFNLKHQQGCTVSERIRNIEGHLSPPCSPLSRHNIIIRRRLATVVAALPIGHAGIANARLISATRPVPRVGGAPAGRIAFAAAGRLVR